MIETVKIPKKFADIKHNEARGPEPTPLLRHYSHFWSDFPVM
jgi:hypothetical protein